MVHIRIPALHRFKSFKWWPRLRRDGIFFLHRHNLFCFPLWKNEVAGKGCNLVFFCMYRYFSTKKLFYAFVKHMILMQRNCLNRWKIIFNSVRPSQNTFSWLTKIGKSEDFSDIDCQYCFWQKGEEEEEEGLLPHCMQIKKNFGCKTCTFLAN